MKRFKKHVNLATEQKVEGEADAIERTKILFWMRYRNKSKLLIIYLR
jgi:hypothetical protein